MDKIDKKEREPVYVYSEAEQETLDQTIEEISTFLDNVDKLLTYFSLANENTFQFIRARVNRAFVIIKRKRST